MSYTIYGGTSCSSCETAKNILGTKGIPFSYKNVDEDIEALELVINNKFRSLPMITLDGELIGTLKDLQEHLTLPST